MLIGGVGTGGTITGAGEFLKSKKAGMRIIAVCPISLCVPFPFPLIFNQHNNQAPLGFIRCGNWAYSPN